MRQSLRFLSVGTAIFLSSFVVTGRTNAAVVFAEDFEYSAANLAANAVAFTASNANVLNPTGLFHDGSSDYFTIVNVPGSPLSGAPNTSVAFSDFSGQFFAAEDIDDASTRPGTQTLSFNINVTNFADLSLDMMFAAGGNDASPGYDANDGFLVRAQVDGGAFQNLLAFESILLDGTQTNRLLRQDADFDGTGDATGFQPTAAATAFNGLAIAGTGTNLLVEFLVSSNDGNGEFAFDSIVLNGTAVAVPEPSSLMMLAFAGSVVAVRRRRR